jgi:hypothetical protein
LHTEIANAMLKYYYDGKFEQRLGDSSTLLTFTHEIL